MCGNAATTGVDAAVIVDIDATVAAAARRAAGGPGFDTVLARVDGAIIVDGDGAVVAGGPRLDAFLDAVRAPLLVRSI